MSVYLSLYIFHKFRYFKGGKNQKTRPRRKGESAPGRWENSSVSGLSDFPIQILFVANCQWADIFWSPYNLEKALIVHPPKMAVSVSASSISSFNSEPSTRLVAAAASSSSYCSKKLSSLSSLQFPARTWFLRIGTATSSRRRILPHVTNLSLHSP